MFAFDFRDVEHSLDREFWVILCIAGFFSFLTLAKTGLKLQEMIFFAKKYSLKGYVLGTLMFLVLIITCISSITSSGFNPFIYFRF